MSVITLSIDGKDVAIEAGSRVLAAARGGFRSGCLSLMFGRN
jgi:hypothetical protein